MWKLYFLRTHFSDVFLSLTLNSSVWTVPETLFTTVDMVFVDGQQRYDGHCAFVYKKNQQKWDLIDFKLGTIIIQQFIRFLHLLCHMISEDF